MADYHDSSTHSLTHLAALVAIERHTSAGDIASPDAVAALKNLRAAVFFDVPVVELSPEDRLVARIGAPLKEEETDG